MPTILLILFSTAITAVAAIVTASSRHRLCRIH
jgi:hypothetical protein